MTGAPVPPHGPGMRLDKWLWAARFFRQRDTAREFLETGKARLNGRVIEKAAATVRVGDVLTFPWGHLIRVVEVLALAEKRGDAATAQRLYRDKSSAAESLASPPGSG